MKRKFSCRDVGLCALLASAIGCDFAATEVGQSIAPRANSAGFISQQSDSSGFNSLPGESGPGESGPGESRPGESGSEKIDRHAGYRPGDLHRNPDKTLARNIARLEKGIDFLGRQPAYTATFSKQEVVTDSLRDMQTIDLKLRHAPFSVYMKWRDSKEEVLYADGQNNNKMRVHHVGFKSLLGDLDLAPDSALARTECRHPITEIGMRNLARTLLSYRKRDLGLAAGITVRQVADEKIDGRDCECFVAVYDSSTIEPVYRKSICCLDKEWSIPVCVKCYGWGDDESPASDEATLLERYEYRDVKFGQLADFDFDSRNAAYAFKQ